ncbi:hypothetical protein D3C86_1591820 [compost metagenome]
MILRHFNPCVDMKVCKEGGHDEETSWFEQVEELLKRPFIFWKPRQSLNGKDDIEGLRSVQGFDVIQIPR